MTEIKTKKITHSSKNNDESIFKILADHSSDVLATIDKDATITYVNQAVVDGFGYLPKHIIGKKIWGYIHPDDLKNIQTYFTRSLSKQGKQQTRELRVKHAKGHWVYAKLKIDNQLYEPKSRCIIATISNIAKNREIEHELQLSIQKNKAILNALPDLMFIITREGVYEDFHAFDEKKLAIPPKKIIGKKIDEAGFSKEDIKRIKTAIQRSLRHGSIETFEYSLPIKDKTFIFEARIAPCDKNRVLAIVRDITKQKEIEKLLKRQSEEYRLLIENQQDIIVKLDHTGAFTYVSPSFFKLLGKTSHNPIGAKLETYVHKDDQMQITKMIQSVKKTKDVIYLESRIISTAGWRWIAWKFNPSMNKENNSIEIIAAGRDITTQKETEFQLSETKEHLQGIVDNARELILTFDSNLRVSTWNKSAEKITGFSKNAVLFKQPTQIAVFKNPEELEKNIINVFNKKQAGVGPELSLNTKDGETITVSCSTSTILNKDKQPANLLIIGRFETKNMLTETLAEGNAYLYLDDAERDMTRRFQYLIDQGYNGLSITRGNKEHVTKFSRMANTTIHLFSNEKIDTHPIVSSPSDLVKHIKTFIQTKKSPVVCIDRLDFLLTHYPFEEIMKSIYKIHSLVISSKSILLLHAKTSLLTTQQLALLKEELSIIPSEKINDIILEGQFYDILEYIMKENDLNSIVSYKNIGKTFSISKVTTQKRINTLNEKGLITVKKRGKMKTLFVTEKARKLLKKQK